MRKNKKPLDPIYACRCKKCGRGIERMGWGWSYCGMLKRRPASPICESCYGGQSTYVRHEFP